MSGSKVAEILAEPPHQVNAPIALKRTVTETKPGASKPVLPTTDPERRPRDRTSTAGVRRGSARARYAVATKREKGRMLDEYCRTTRCHRKAAIRRLGGAAAPAASRPGRPRQYSRELIPVLERGWQASDYLCGKLLSPMVA